MPPMNTECQKDLRFVQQLLQGDETVAAEFRKGFRHRLVGLLTSKGAGVSEAEDLVEDLFSDCFGGSSRDRPLLSRYKGLCPFRSWLATVATHRLFDLKRRGALRRSALDGRSPEFDSADENEAHTRPGTDLAIFDLIRSALNTGFGTIAPELLLMLKLRHSWGVSQRELARMWGWSEFKVCRALDAAREQIRVATRGELARLAPECDLQWRDIADLCRYYDLGLHLEQ
jgi:DNA-directed RNA polymerase specialized sigma24 family protein